MLSIGRILFFMQQYHKQLKKKWGTLLLLFLFPIVLIGLLLWLIGAILIPEEGSPIRVVLVDEDQTKESLLFGKLLEETASGNPFLQFVSLPEADAEELMKRNEISTYFSFPEGFTADLYEGNSVTIPIVGNPARTTESYVVKELVESMTRYIAAAQANILTINDYVKKTDLTKQERQELLFQQFMDFTLYTLGKEKLLDEEVITNVATSSPTHYYVLAGWFTVMSIWLLAIYSVLGKEEHPSMVVRMQLFGVTLWQRVIARILVALVYCFVLAAVLFFIVNRVVAFELYAVDYYRFGLFTAIYALLFLISVTLIDVWVTSRKMGLLLQSLFMFLIILTSGALIPTLYFPQEVQGILPYLFSYESMNWMIDIVLEGRNYADFTTLTIYGISGLVILWCSTRLKEGWWR